MKVKIYHNPRCSKSRQTLEILNRKNLDIDIVEYLKSPLDINEISNLLKKLGYTARDLLRKGEDVYKNENPLTRKIHYWNGYGSINNASDRTFSREYFYSNFD